MYLKRLMLVLTLPSLLTTCKGYFKFMLTSFSLNFTSAIWSSSCSISSCDLEICNTDQNTCETGGCVWDNTNNACCGPGKIFDTDLQKCIYDPNGITVILRVGEESKFVFNGELHKLKFDSFKNSATTTVTVSSLPQTSDLSVGSFVDVNLNSTGDTINDFRVRLNTIFNNNPTTGNASFTYLISEEGLCSSTTCNGAIGKSACNQGFGYCTIGTTCNFYEPNKRFPTSACCLDGKIWDGQECVDFQISGRCSNFGEYDSTQETVCCQASQQTGFWFKIRRF